MFNTFGFMTVEQINTLADNLLNEGDAESIKILAKENGIGEDFAEYFLSGDIPILCDAQSLALGHIDIMAAELKTKEIMEDWVEYLRGQVMEDEAIMNGVLREDKNLEGMIAELLKWSFGHQIQIDKRIVEAAGVKARVTLGIPGMETAKKLIREYYER